MSNLHDRLQLFLPGRSAAAHPYVRMRSILQLLKFFSRGGGSFFLLSALRKMLLGLFKMRVVLRVQPRPSEMCSLRNFRSTSFFMSLISELNHVLDFQMLVHHYFVSLMPRLKVHQVTSAWISSLYLHHCNFYFLFNNVLKTQLSLR